MYLNTFSVEKYKLKTEDEKLLWNFQLSSSKEEKLLLVIAMWWKGQKKFQMSYPLSARIFFA